MTTTSRFIGSLVLATLLATSAACAGGPRVIGSADAHGSYAVVVSEETKADPDWSRVVDALLRKYDGAAFTWKTSVEESLDGLREMFPRYVCFVARPEEADRPLIVTLHRMMRRLDDDPYGDALWAVLTGYDADDALRIASRREPLIVRRALSGTDGVTLDAFAEGRRFSESRAGYMEEKTPDGKIAEDPGEADSIERIVAAFNDYEPQAFFTSGHATTEDWQPGYSYRNGSMRCDDGQLYGLDMEKRRHDINSQNPKVFLPVGNCLIGNIPERDCMALALMHTAGVYQMFGYTVVTFFGYGGWGVNTYWLGEAGRRTLAESWFLNTQALLHEILTNHPEAAKPKIDDYDFRRLRRRAAELGLKSQDAFGLLWDRDTVALYGDPAWEARLEERALPWGISWKRNGAQWTLAIDTSAEGSWPNRPVIAWLPERIENPKVTAGAKYNPVATDIFVLVPLSGEYKPAERIEITVAPE